MGCFRQWAHVASSLGRHVLRLPVVVLSGRFEQCPANKSTEHHYRCEPGQSVGDVSRRGSIPDALRKGLGPQHALAPECGCHRYRLRHQEHDGLAVESQLTKTGWVELAFVGQLSWDRERSFVGAPTIESRRVHSWKLHRGNCETDRRHIFNLSGVAEVPQFSNSTLRHVASGWRVAPIFKILSGGYLSIVTSSDIALTGILNSSGGSTDRPADRLGQRVNRLVSNA